MFRPLHRSLLLLLALVLALPMTAQTLIEQVPSSAALYAGWRGADDLGPDYEGSNLQGMLEEIGLRDAVPEVMELIEQLGEEGKIKGDEAQMAAMAATLLSSAWADGGAMYMLPPEQNGPPIPRLCVMWNKGDVQAQLREALNMVVGILGEQLPTFTGELDGVMYLSIGFNPADADGDFAPLSDSARFKTAAKHIQGDAALMVYVDAKEWIKQLDQFAQMMRDQAEDSGPANPFGQMWPTVRDATGLAGVDSLAFSAGLKDKNWHSRMFLGAPVPRRGLLSLLDHEPIEPASLLYVPKTATYLQVFSMQPSRVLDVTMDVAGKIDPNAVESINAVMKEASDAVGFDLEMKLIRGLGPVWSMYVDPMIAGNGFASIVLVNELQDAKSVEQSMAMLSAAANREFADEDEVKVRFISEDIAGTTVTHLGVPFIAPAWTVHNNRLYVSLYPQALEMAIEQSGKRDDSILANEAFQSAFARFADAPAGGAAKAKAFENLKPITGLSFADLPETATEGYGMTMMIMQALSGSAEMLTGEASSIRMPPVGKLMPYIEVTGGITRVDADGLHVHLIEPFPGATMLGASKGLTSGAGLTAPMGVAVLLPALGSAREAARHAQTMAQGRQIAIANFAYATDNKGQFADDPIKLEEYIGDTEIFISPRSTRGQALPANFDALPEAQKAQQLRKASSFVLVPLGDMAQVQNPSKTVMLFERPDGTDASELVVAMADGSAQTIAIDELEDMLEQQTGKSSNALIQRQENFGQ